MTDDEDDSHDHHQNDDGHDSEGSEFENSWGGSQYSSPNDDDTQSLSSPNGPNEGPEGEEEETRVQVGAMRVVRTFAMRTIVHAEPPKPPVKLEDLDSWRKRVTQLIKSQKCRTTIDLYDGLPRTQGSVETSSQSSRSGSIKKLRSYAMRSISTIKKKIPSESRVQSFASNLLHSSNIRRKKTNDNFQPVRDPHLQATLAAEVEINGVKAFTLFDSGSTTDSITPEFAFATKAKQITLDEQVVLQLGCVGSRSKICYGTKVPVKIGKLVEDTYFDLVNLDRYDCIIGTPFLNRYGVSLDFKTRTIRVGNSEIKAFSYDEENKFVKNRKPYNTGSRFNKQLPKPPPVPEYADVINHAVSNSLSN